MSSLRAIRRLIPTGNVCKRRLHSLAQQTVPPKPVQPTLDLSNATGTPNVARPSTRPQLGLPHTGTTTSSDPTKPSKARADAKPDPFALVSTELTQLRTSMLTLMGSAHPGLTQIAEYYFLQPSKQLRPLLVLLFSKATNGLGRDWNQKLRVADFEAAKGLGASLDAPLNRADVLNDWNPNIPEHTASFSSVFNIMAPPSLSKTSTSSQVQSIFEPHVTGTILPTQVRLAQIAEMIHVASLLHDDVIDTSPLRRGVPSGPANFGNKLSVLGGDFLLGRASAALSRLGENEVVELVASVIANLVEGEVMQVREVHAPETLHEAIAIGQQANASSRVSEERWNMYLKKTYLKTASLMAKTVRGAVVLGGSKDGEIWKEVAYAYGRNIGIAFQLIDDMLDFAVSDESFGKPSGGADLRLGLATAPTLYAWEEFEEMGPLIQRRFEGAGDVDLARQIVGSSQGVERTRELAETYAAKAKEVLNYLPESEAKDALYAMADIVTRRKH